MQRYATVNSLISVEIIIYKYSSVFPRHINELEKNVYIVWLAEK